MTAKDDLLCELYQARYDRLKEMASVSDLPKNGKELLLMGGAYGHMSHPFDDKDLTFGDLKKIITLGISGQ